MSDPSYSTHLLKSLQGDPKALQLTPKQIERWGYDRPDSVLHLMQDEDLGKAIARIPDGVFSMTEKELKERLGSDRPSPVDKRVRIAFWQEYEAAAREHRAMDLTTMMDGTGGVSWPAYRESLCLDSNLLAWFMKPPASYALAMKEVHELGLDRLREIMTLPIKTTKTVKGKKVEVVDHKIALLILSAYKLVDMRQHGAFTQKMVNLNFESQAPDPEKGEALNGKEIDEKLAELEKILSGAPAPLKLKKPEEKEVRQIEDAEVIKNDNSADDPGRP